MTKKRTRSAAETARRQGAEVPTDPLGRALAWMRERARDRGEHPRLLAVCPHALAQANVDARLLTPEVLTEFTAAVYPAACKGFRARGEGVPPEEDWLRAGKDFPVPDPHNILRAEEGLRAEGPWKLHYGSGRRDPDLCREVGGLVHRISRNGQGRYYLHVNGQLKAHGPLEACKAKSLEIGGAPPRRQNEDGKDSPASPAEENEMKSLSKTVAVGLLQACGLKVTEKTGLEALQKKVDKLSDLNAQEAINLEDEEMAGVLRDVLARQAAGKSVTVEDDTPAPEAGNGRAADKPARKKSGGAAREGGPSNKEVVYRAWAKAKAKDKDDPQQYHDKVGGNVQLGTIRGWISAWKRGQNLPACAKEKEAATA